MNYIKTGLLMVVMAGLFLGIGYLLGGSTGLVVALGFSLVFNLGAFWFSKKMALGMAGAKPMSKSEYPWLFQANEEFSKRAGIPSPELYLSPDPQPNAFACGRSPSDAAVSFNKGLIDNMSQREVLGVLAHELAHIKNRDMLTMTVTACIASAIMMISNFALFFGGGDEERPNPLVAILIMLVGPIAASLVQMAVSRSREYAADETGAEIMGDPLPLADALNTLGQTTRVIQSPAAQPATAHLYIANPLSGRSMMSLFSTHPPMEERIRRLRLMAQPLNR